MANSIATQIRLTITSQEHGPWAADDTFVIHLPYNSNRVPEGYACIYEPTLVEVMKRRPASEQAHDFKTGPAHYVWVGTTKEFTADPDGLAERLAAEATAWGVANPTPPEKVVNIERFQVGNAVNDYPGQWALHIRRAHPGTIGREWHVRSHPPKWAGQSGLRPDDVRMLDSALEGATFHFEWNAWGDYEILASTGESYPPTNLAVGLGEWLTYEPLGVVANAAHKAGVVGSVPWWTEHSGENDPTGPARAAVYAAAKPLRSAEVEVKYRSHRAAEGYSEPSELARAEAAYASAQQSLWKARRVYDEFFKKPPE